MLLWVIEGCERIKSIDEMNLGMVLLLVLYLTKTERPSSLLTLFYFWGSHPYMALMLSAAFLWWELC